ncbi:MAG: RNase J family beta-CASP ribonuclease [Firmicutes bacterium]|nr:RNase J family beta-CASP ribonuclease [Bacillota bacterium]
MTEKKDSGDIRALGKERIRGVDVVVNRAIERLLAADGAEEKTADAKSKPRQKKKAAEKADKKENEKNAAKSAPQAKGETAKKRTAPPQAKAESPKRRKSSADKSKSAKSSSSLGGISKKAAATRAAAAREELAQVSSSQAFIANPLAVSQQKYRQGASLSESAAGSKEYKLKVIPLGGLGEVGKNMTVVQYGEDIIVVDAGMAFPDDDMPGVDLVIPDYSYLVEHRDHVRAICLTHGHEDHIGCLPYLLKDVQAPVYGSPLTLGMLKGKLAENKVTAELHDVAPRDVIAVGPFKVEFFRLTHSIPDSMGMAIYCPMGTILVVSDFKMDMSPIDGQFMDFGRISALGEKGVLLLLSDSTNAEQEGFVKSERTVGYNLDKIFYRAEGRIIVTSFASHVHRVQQVLWSAQRCDRKVAIVGRGMQNMVAVAGSMGYLDIPDGLVVDIESINSLPADRVVVITTGSQGEPLSGLTRMAGGDHRQVQIMPGDTVVISATPIPGNERTVARTVDNLFRLGATVIYERNEGIHVSGHGYREELRMLLNMVKPRFFMPVHGEYRMLYKHAQLAQESGMPAENTFVMENGQVLEVSRRMARVNGSVTSGRVFIDGLGVGDVGKTVLKERRQLSESGVIVISMIYTKQKNPRILLGPEIYSRGFIFEKEYEHIIGEMKEKVVAICTPEKLADGSLHDLRIQIRTVLSRYVMERTGRRPVIMAIICEV